MMRIDELERTLDRYGGDIGRWPDTLRDEANALIASDATAARLVTRAAKLDDLLAEAMLPVPVDAALIGRIVAGLDSRQESMLRPTPRLAAWAGAAMIAFLSAGYVAGVMLPVSEGEDALAGLMFGSSVTASDTAGGESESVL